VGNIYFIVASFFLPKEPVDIGHYLILFCFLPERLGIDYKQMLNILVNMRHRITPTFWAEQCLKIPLPNVIILGLFHIVQQKNEGQTSKNDTFPLFVEQWPDLKAKFTPKFSHTPLWGGQRGGKKAGGACLHSPGRPPVLQQSYC
jgi:hypothetical protein